MTEMELKPGRIKAVVFDLYGTLVQHGRITNPYKQLFQRLEISEEEMQAARLMAQKENFASLADLAQRLKPDFLPQDHQDLLRRLEAEVAAEVAAVSLFPETRAVLEKLKRRKFRMGIISNLSAPFKGVVPKLGLDRYADEIAFSCDVGYVKPQPEIYVLMITQLGFEPCQVIMTGDQVHKDCDVPKSLGMKGVHLDRAGRKPGSIATLEGIFRYV